MKEQNKELIIRDIVKLYDILIELSNRQLIGTVAFKIAILLKAFEATYKEFFNQKENILLSFGGEIEKLSENQLKEAQSKLDTIANEKIDIIVPSTKFNAKDFNDVKIEPVYLLTFLKLGFMDDE
ncbi:hypothetical protein GF373_17465 [bacterium]|nr:hypothetical protein [bacterium]